MFLLIYAFFVFYAPNFLGDPQNYIPANPLQTPPDIVPEWYFLPFYAILRSVPDKLLGVIMLFSSILVLFVLPWLDTSPVRSARFRPVYNRVFWLLVIDVLALGYVGAHPPEGMVVTIGRIATFYYFFHFLILFPLIGWFERPRPLPTSIAAAVLGSGPSARRIAAGESLTWRGIDSRRRSLPRRCSSGAGGRRAGPRRRRNPAPAAPAMVVRRRFRHLRPRRLQRGFQVYKQVCSACHPVKHLHFGDLAALGYTPSEIKAIAASDQVTDGPNDQGEMFQRPGRPSDPIPGPFPNDQAARAAEGGALPPDLSLIVKARDGGPDYVYAHPERVQAAAGRVQGAAGTCITTSISRAIRSRCRRRSATARSSMPTAPRRRCRRWRTMSRRFLNWASEPNLDDAASHRGQGDAVSDRCRRRLLRGQAQDLGGGPLSRR